MAYLVLARHGLSEYNKQGLWTGWADPGLAPEGFEEAKKAGRSLTDIHFDFAYSADLKRARQTLDEILKELNLMDLPIKEARELRERSYGIFTGKNKWQVKEKVGDEEFQRIRRGWDHPIQEGESLKQVNARIWSYYQSEIFPKLREGKNVIISSSGNAFRGLIKSLEDIPEDKIADLEFGIGEVYVYEIDKEGRIISKEVRAQNPLKGKI
ncbi:2,3-bisphosphoglycerate-dependent phosphoglycerate mutase [Candidatus Daviesbacteria bacterium]|nr:2,3-bisphosphoglycerate-dependent phosphoglycerate mutase [Candidatus Daviesbacteria bacterium]